jgi:hypothetical protein
LLLPLLFQALSPGIFSSQTKEKKEKHEDKKNHRKEKKNTKKGGSSPFFSRFCIWDETFLLISTLHIPSTLSFSPSSSLMSTSPQSCMLLKLGSSPELWRWNEREMRKGGRRGGEVCRRENFGAEKGAEKSLSRGRGCVFDSSSKRLEQSHPELHAFNGSVMFAPCPSLDSFVGFISGNPRPEGICTV